VETSAKTGRQYFWNKVTGESKYEIPQRPAVPQAAELPCGIATLERAEQAEAAGDLVEALACYNTAIGEALVLLDRHPPLRTLVDELMERALSIRPQLVSPGEARRRPQPTTPSAASRDLIGVAAAASATPREAGFRKGGDGLGLPPRERAPVNARARRVSRGYKADPTERPVNKRVILQSNERAVSADALPHDAHAYDTIGSPENSKRTGSSKAVAWGTPKARFSDNDPASIFYQAVKSPPPPSSVVQIQTLRPDAGSSSSSTSPATTASDGVGWGPPPPRGTSDRFDKPGSHLHTASLSTPAPGEYTLPVSAGPPPARTVPVPPARTTLRYAAYALSIAITHLARV